MIEPIQVVTGAAIGIFLLAVAFTIGHCKGHVEGYQEGLMFGYLAAKSGAELLANDDDNREMDEE